MKTISQHFNIYIYIMIHFVVFVHPLTNNHLFSSNVVSIEKKYTLTLEARSLKSIHWKQEFATNHTKDVISIKCSKLASML